MFLLLKVENELGSGGSTMVEQSTHNPKFFGSNPGYREEIASRQKSGYLIGLTWTGMAIASTVLARISSFAQCWIQTGDL